jgi:hypothetical protein
MRTKPADEVAVAVSKGRLGRTSGRGEVTFTGRPDSYFTGRKAAEGRAPWFAGHVWAEA